MQVFEELQHRRASLQEDLGCARSKCPQDVPAGVVQKDLGARKDGVSCPATCQDSISHNFCAPHIPRRLLEVLIDDLHRKILVQGTKRSNIRCFSRAV